MKRLLALILVLALLGPSLSQPEGPDDQYVRIYNLIQEADTLSNSGQSAQALAKYLQAQSALQQLQRGYLDWNPKVVSFRLNYLAARIPALSVKASASTTATSSPTNAAAHAKVL